MRDYFCDNSRVFFCEGNARRVWRRGSAVCSRLDMNQRLPSIAVDVMGSDMGPAEIIAGVKQALREDKSAYEIIVVGNEAEITPMLLRANILRDNRVKVYNATEVIGMDENPFRLLSLRGIRR